MGLLRRTRQSGIALAGCAAIGAFALTTGEPSAQAQAGPGLQLVSYASYHFEVPATWPVFDLSSQPRTCVRFDLHAVYLGTPGPNQNCPSWLLGATEALVIGPGPAAAARQSAENPVSHEITATAPGIAVTATFDQDPGTITAILASAGLAAPSATTASSSASAAATGAQAGHATATELTVSAAKAQGTAASTTADPMPPLPASVAADVGLGFDTCTAPSSDAMQAWLAGSPYRAVGIYIGGADRACSQPNLSPAWVRQQAMAGWHFIPLYPGPQSAFGQITAPAQQGTADAADAVAQAQQLGFGPGTPLYYDMEAYPPAESAPTLQFLSAWTTELHQLGYASGVYSSSDSGISDIVAQVGTGYPLPDVLYDALWNGQANTVDANVPAGDWQFGQRIHQFAGNVLQSYGGVSMLIDQDYLDVALAPPAAATGQASAAVTETNGSTFVFVMGHFHQLIEQTTNGAGQWARIDLGGYLTSAPSAVLVGSSLDVFYRGGDNALVVRSSTPSGFSPEQRLGQFGPVGVPEAVAQPSGVIDVFWRGFGGTRLWHAQFNPGSGWAGPQSLQGRLASDPYPVVTPTGDVQVFWMGGRDHNLWRVVRGGVTGTWTAPQDLGMGPLGGAPQAVVLTSGEIDVFWRRGAAPRSIEMAALRPGAASAGPANPGGAFGRLQPWSVVAAGSEWLVFRGHMGGLRQIHVGADGTWTLSAWQTGVAGLRSAPFAAAGPASGPLDVFWTGTDGHLWVEQYTPAGGWNGPTQLGIAR